MEVAKLVLIEGRDTHQSFAVPDFSRLYGENKDFIRPTGCRVARQQSNIQVHVFAESWARPPPDPLSGVWDLPR